MKLYNEDCLHTLLYMPDESIDLVLTDCPYHIVQGGCTTGAYGNPGGVLNHDYTKNGENIEYTRQGKIFKHNDIKFEEWLPHIFRILKPDTHCYIMINPRNVAELQAKAEKVGFKFQNILIWYKNNSTPNRYYLNSYEMILMLRKGKARNINNMGTKNVLEIKNIIGNKSHPTEKPVELMKILIENSTNGGGDSIRSIYGNRSYWRSL